VAASQLASRGREVTDKRDRTDDRGAGREARATVIARATSPRSQGERACVEKHHFADGCIGGLARPIREVLLVHISGTLVGEFNLDDDACAGACATRPSGYRGGADRWGG
jgi:hypothetical protein